MNKKAVSPIIATVILIVFAIILGIIVMNVGASHIVSAEEEGTENVSILDIVDRCVDQGCITEEEGNVLAGSLA